MDFKSYFNEKSCSLDQPYGGMPESGGYNPITEYEIGAQRIAEAAHCILGSLHKGKARKDAGNPNWEIEQGHIEEEFQIIENAVEEYARPLYSKQLTREGMIDLYGEVHEDRMKIAKKSVQHIKKVSPKLAELAEERKNNLFMNQSIPDSVRFLALDSYDVIFKLAQAMDESISDWPDIVHNAFNMHSLNEAVRELKHSVKDFIEWSDDK